MAWNLTDESFIRSQTNDPVAIGNHKFNVNSKKEQHEIFSVLTRLKTFREEGVFCDVKLHVGQTQFDAHKAVLAAWSPKLASLLLGQDDLSSELLIHSEHEKAFADCLEYMYSGFLSPNDSNVISLLDLGRGLLIEGLVTVCENYLQKCVNHQNFVSKYFVSLKYNLKVLEEIIVDFIETNIATVIEQPNLLNLQPPDFKQFLTSGKMSSVAQEVKFSLIISWVGFDIPDRDKYMMHLFDLVNWNHSVNDLLIQISCTQNIFTTSEFCLFQLLHSLVTTVGHHLGPFITAYPRLFSVYSHMLDDLSHPNAFHAAGQYHQELAPILITHVLNKSVMSLRKETKDTAVNTDFEFDLSAFQATFIPPEIAETTTEVCKVEVLKDNVDTDIAMPTDSTVPVTETLEANANENSQLNVKHRRKSLPRKLPRRSTNKEPKERKRKAKKHIIKESEVVKNANPENEVPVSERSKNGGHVVNVNIHVDEKEENTVDYILTGNARDATAETNKSSHTADENKHENEHEKADFKKARLKITLKRGKGILKKSKGARARVKIAKPVVARAPRMSEPGMLRVHCTYEDCDFSSKAADVLEKHVERVHMISVHLSCWKCEFTAREMRDLCQHLKDHFPKAPFICDFGPCCMRFLRLGLFVRHHMSHMKEKPYQCDMCMKSFATYNQLSCHKKLHEGKWYRNNIRGIYVEVHC